MASFPMNTKRPKNTSRKYKINICQGHRSGRKRIKKVRFFRTLTGFGVYSPLLEFDDAKNTFDGIAITIHVEQDAASVGIKRYVTNTCFLIGYSLNFFHR